MNPSHPEIVKKIMKKSLREGDIPVLGERCQTTLGTGKKIRHYRL